MDPSIPNRLKKEIEEKSPDDQSIAYRPSLSQKYEFASEQLNRFFEQLIKFFTPRS